MPAVFDEDKNQMAEGAAIVPMTDKSGGTPSNTIADVPAAYTEATLANQIGSLTMKVNEFITALTAQTDFAAD